MKKVSIGGCSAFWGDRLDPAVLMAETADVQYLAFDHLAELTMSLLHRMKVKNPERGFIPDIIAWHRVLLPITTKRGIKMVSNGGGANPIAGATAVVGVAKELGIIKTKGAWYYVLNPETGELRQPLSAVGSSCGRGMWKSTRCRWTNAGTAPPRREETGVFFPPVWPNHYQL